ncbi:hypothetical protein K3N28_20900 [Glycomyces sp. TRM65418]|uniref:hypothetical protein n=1 Tax=Glycomyces sp. TRM65418 TaxID=2867006 RepID=UPI001CE695F6|nr:hypothetical protein [Glycomyces sp. TRM65418]MCC3765524.1 hypothetical protein [Glycomyces sp. TRM65418]QZD55131.1 hypothetical protein K3N28_20795 [Glycomyces sp. TRM65418]
MEVVDPPWAATDIDDQHLRGFADRIARPLLLDIATDGDDRVRVPVEPTGPAVPLPAGLHRMLEDAAYPGGGVDSATPLRQRVLGTIAASAPQRFEVRSAVNPHRAYPAAHCFFSAQVFLLAAGGAWHYDAAGHRLWPVSDHADLDAALEGGARLAVISHLGSIPTRYRELRWSLSLCEAGHLSELLAQAAHAHGLPVRLRHDLPDAPLLDRLGLRAADGWIPAAVIELGEAADRPHRPAPAHRTGMSWSEVLFERSAGRANKGYTPAPVPLPAEAMAAVLRAVAETTAAVPTAAEGGIDFVLIARQVDGFEPGCYRLEPGRPPRPVAGPDMAAVQRSFSYPPEQMAVSGCPAALLMICDHDAAIRAGGERGLRALQLQMGATAQAAGMSITPHRGFLRPARSFDPDPLAADLGLPSTQLPIYLALMGASRFIDLLLDVRQ